MSGVTVRDKDPGIPVRLLQVEVVQGPDQGRRVCATADTLSIGSADGNELVLADPLVSRFHLELARRPDGVLVTDLQSTNGTFAGVFRLERAIVPRDTQLRVGRSVLHIGDGDEVSLPLHAENALAGLRGGSSVMRRVMARVERAARSDVSVLVVGESGTGKELVARALHELSPRAKGPFVTVDCGTLSPTLVAAELFGYEKGAFTGAERQHIGAFEQADGGTLFLDEIGELPLAIQATLLGALERRRFRRVGGRNDIDVDVRVVFATHRDLRAEVNRGGFRLDLYYRIAVVVLGVPPLRERLEDVPLLVEHFARASGFDGAIAELFPPDVMTELEAHHWTGNVRELRNVVEATLAMGEPPALDPQASGAVDAPDALLELRYKDARARVLTEFERRYLVRLLQRAGDNVSRAAGVAGLDRTHLGHLLQRHRLR
jgi:DNA-binding NtrC family response regulator